MFRKSRARTMKEQAGNGTALAVELAQDEKFRKELIGAVVHGIKARDRASKRIGPLATLQRLAADEQLRRDLSHVAENLQAARARVEKKRSRRFPRMLLLIVPAGAIVAIPQARSWIMERFSGLLGGGEGGFGGPTVITESIEVEVPLSTAYNQWTQFEDFPQFMEGVEEVKQLDDTRLHWTATVAGQRAEWHAKILEQHPDRQISWISEDGKQTRGTVSFEELGSARTRVELSMSYQAQGPAEALGSAAGLDAMRVRGDLKRFKEMIESRESETGAWRGEVVAGETR